MDQNAPGEIEIAEWWNKRRPRYNLGLVVAGILAFISYAAVVVLRAPQSDEVEITRFTMVFQGFGYLVMMGFANLCYSLGPVAERFLGPKDPARFRKVSYALGCGFSFALPFVVPVLLLVRFA